MELQMTIFDFVNPSSEKTVRPIASDDAKPFILGIHYARRMPCIQYAYGLFEGERIVGVVTFGQPATPSTCYGIAGEKNKGNVLELNRLVMLPDKNEKNNASYLVGNALKMLPHGTFVVSYADWGGWHHVGYIYQATNFLYTGMTKERTDMFSGKHARHYTPGETRRVVRTAKHRYVYLCGNRREKKRMRKELKWNVIGEYPKGDSRRYDTNDPHGVAI